MVYVIADIHGSVSRLSQILYGLNLNKDDYVIIAGDAGLRYGQYNMGSLKKAMKSFPCKFVIMRGNHDARYEKIARIYEPGKWEFLIDGMFYEPKYPNILYVKDTGGVYDIDEKKILFVPGGYSVDKWYRMQMGYPWEPEEELSDLEFKKLYSISDSQEYDYVISHIAPYKINSQLQDLFLDGIDQSTVSTYSEEMCNYFYDKHNWKLWVFGHYHADRLFDGNMVMVYNKFAILE